MQQGGTGWRGNGKLRTNMFVTLDTSQPAMFELSASAFLNIDCEARAGQSGCRSSDPGFYLIQPGNNV